MHPALLLAIYCGLTIIGSLAGGWVPLIVKLTHRRMQIAISFVSGMILGIGLLHLLPHSFGELGSIDLTVYWLLGGFLFMFFLERFFHFHHHDAPDDMSSLAAPALHIHDDHDHGHEHAHGHSHDKPAPAFSWSGAAIGLTLHSLVDGVALAAAVQAESESGAAYLAGLGTCLAIALHKPFDSLTVGTLMAAAGRSTSVRHVLNALYSLVTPLGVLLFYVASESGQHPQGLGQALGFAAGAFVCIATSDLLPELQFHRHDRSSLSLALLAGIALAWSTIFLEGGAHGHDHAIESEHAAEHGH